MTQHWPNRGIICDDGNRCPYMVANCGRGDSHADHDWRPKLTPMSAPQPMRHCPGSLLVLR